jgi:MinD superfamily P-loop ATPase
VETGKAKLLITASYAFLEKKTRVVADCDVDAAI